MMDKYKNNDLVLEPKLTSTSTDKTASASCREWSTWFEFNGKYRFQASKVVQVLIGLLALFVITTLVYHYRICMLEADRDAFKSQLSKTREEIRQLRRHIQLPETSDENSDESAPEPDSNDDDQIRPILRTRRNALIPENETDRYSEEVSGNISSIQKLNFSVPLTPISRPREDRSRRFRGNSCVRLSERRKWRRENVRVKKLKAKLKTCRRNYKSLLANSNYTSGLDEPQAVYIIPTAPNVDIIKPKQIIGPWYIAKNGNDYGFNDLWYKGISLDQNRTSIVFEESGLFLVFSQVYYHITLGRDEKPLPMGYRIHLRKNEQSKIFRRPIPIAECVPSFPTTYYQTCFTQIAWYMEAGDQIFLEHFTKSTPVIESDSHGKTFIGIVKLSGFR